MDGLSPEVKDLVVKTVVEALRQAPPMAGIYVALLAGLFLVAIVVLWRVFRSTSRQQVDAMREDRKTHIDALKERLDQTVETYKNEVVAAYRDQLKEVKGEIVKLQDRCVPCRLAIGEERDALIGSHRDAVDILRSSLEAAQEELKTSHQERLDEAREQIRAMEDYSRAIGTVTTSNLELAASVKVMHADLLAVQKAVKG